MEKPNRKNYGPMFMRRLNLPHSSTVDHSLIGIKDLFHDMAGFGDVECYFSVMKNDSCPGMK